MAKIKEAALLWCSGGTNTRVHCMYQAPQIAEVGYKEMGS
jgi:hypothetical protein